MKKRLALSFVTIGLVALLVGGSTFAYFSDTATNSNNTFTAGTLQVAAGEMVNSPTVNIDNMAPGDVITGSFTVDNVGTLPFNFTVVANENTVTGKTNIWDVADVTFTPTSGSLTAQDATVTTDSTVVEYTITFPSTAGNTYQGAAGTLSFTVNANQQ